MGTHQHVHEKSPPRRCGARRLISTTKSRLMPALHPEWTPLRAHAAMESRAKSTVQLEPGTAGDNGFTSGARR
jgi:hypothetical protein